MDNNYISLTSFDFISEEKIESFKFIETNDGNFIEVIKRIKSSYPFSFTTTNFSNPLDRVVKELYGISRGKDGKKQLSLIKSIEGNIKPGYYVDESFEFNE